MYGHITPLYHRPNSEIMPQKPSQQSHKTGAETSHGNRSIVKLLKALHPLCLLLTCGGKKQTKTPLKYTHHLVSPFVASSNDRRSCCCAVLPLIKTSVTLPTVQPSFVIMWLVCQRLLLSSDMFAQSDIFVFQIYKSTNHNKIMTF